MSLNFHENDSGIKISVGHKIYFHFYMEIIFIMLSYSNIINQPNLYVRMAQGGHGIGRTDLPNVNSKFGRRNFVH